MAGAGQNTKTAIRFASCNQTNVIGKFALYQSPLGRGFLIAALMLGVAGVQPAAPSASESVVVSESEPESYTLGVFPFLPPQRLELTFAPMAARFAESLGLPVHFRTSSKFQRFQERLSEEVFDFAIVGPFLFVQLEPETYRPLAQAPGTTTTVFVVLDSSPIQFLTDLRGNTVGLPQHSAPRYLARYTLIQEGLDLQRDLEAKFFDSHFSCLQAVLAGTVAACATPPLILQTFERQMQVQLREVGESVAIPIGLVVAHCRVPEPDVETVRKLLSSWREDERNHLPVPGAQVPSFVPVVSGDYHVVREILRSLKER